MATNKNNPAGSAAASAYADAQQKREQAERRHTEALAAVEAARLADSTLRARLEDGDDGVSAVELAAAPADVERAKLLSEASARAVDVAKAAERSCAAAHLSELLAPVVDPEPLREAQRKAADTIADALRTLAGVASDQHAVIRNATALVKELGLDDPKLRVQKSFMRELLVMDGEGVNPAPVNTLLADAIELGALGAQWRITSKPQLHAVEPPRERIEVESMGTWDSFLREMREREKRAALRALTEVKSESVPA